MKSKRAKTPECNPSHRSSFFLPTIVSSNRRLALDAASELEGEMRYIINASVTYSKAKRLGARGSETRDGTLGAAVN
jgi:hypothetical protein